MNSEILVKASAALQKEIDEIDLKTENKDVEGFLNEITEPCQQGRVRGSDAKDNDLNQEEVSA